MPYKNVREDRRKFTVPKRIGSMPICLTSKIKVMKNK
jgi:hypothetical protein